MTDHTFGDTIRAQSVSQVDFEETTVKIPKETLDYFRKSASELGVSTGDMVRIALGTQKFLSEEVSQGAKVQLKKMNRTFDVKL